MSCPFKDLLGKPGHGIHSARIPGTNIALVDTVATIIASYFIQKRLHMYSYIQVLIGLFILGELLHVLFCVQTPISKKFRH